MKKFLSIGLMIIAGWQGILAQKPDEANTENSPKIRVKPMLTVSKALLDAKESTDINVRVLMPPPAGEEGALPSEVQMPTDGSLPYKAENWRIVQGGGQLSENDSTSYTYTAPAGAPPDKTMIVSVDLVPTEAGRPKVTLLQTLYFSHNETAFFINFPTLGIHDVKYVGNTNNDARSAMQTGLNPQLPPNLPPAVQAQIKQAQARAAQPEPLNMGAMMSNAMAMFDAGQGITVIRFMKLSPEMLGGKPANAPQLAALMAFNFKGKGAGAYSLREKDVGLGFYITATRMGIGCGVNESLSNDRIFPCTGDVVIDSIDDKYIKGTVSTTVYTSVDTDVHTGWLYGKFTVNRVN